MAERERTPASISHWDCLSETDSRRDVPLAPALQLPNDAARDWSINIKNLDIFKQYLSPVGFCDEYFNTPISVRWLAEGGWVYKNLKNSNNY